MKGLVGSFETLISSYILRSGGIPSLQILFLLIFFLHCVMGDPQVTSSPPPGSTTKASAPIASQKDQSSSPIKVKSCLSLPKALFRSVSRSSPFSYPLIVSPWKTCFQDTPKACEQLLKTPQLYPGWEVFPQPSNA